MKLTENQTNMLIAVGLDCVMHNLSWFGARRAEDFFVSTPWYGPVKNFCPRVNNPTGSGRSLIRHGLIYAHADIPEPTAHRRATLTEKGRGLFETLLTPAMREAIAQQAKEAERLRAQEAERERKNRWHDQHRETFAALRERADARRDERHALQRERDDIATKLGRGANDPDNLLARLRVVVQRLDALVVEEAEDAALQPVYEEKT